MKTTIRILLVALATFALPLHAEEASKPAESAPAVETKVSDKASDQFLRFVLQKAEKYSGKMEDAVGAAIDTAKAEVPETMRQFLVWRAWKHGLTFAIAPTLFLVTFTVGVLFYRSTGWKKNEDEAIVGGVLSWIFSGSSLFASFMNLDHLFAFIQIQVAPRIYIIEEVTKLVR